MSSNLVLIDTSAWVRFFDPKAYGEPYVADEVERLILADMACYTEPVYLEIAVGAKTEANLRKFQRNFSALPVMTVCEQHIWAKAADNYLYIVKKGFRKKAMDILIATVAQVYDLVLFHHDGDYKTIARAIALNQYSFLE